MKTNTGSIFTGLMSVAVAGLLFGGVALADSPKTIDVPDRHSVEVKGKLSLYRVQVAGMDLGEGKNKTRAEVFVALDSKPGTVYTLSLRSSKNDDGFANREIANTLRTAYVNRLPVTLYRQFSGLKDNNYKILMVQLD